MEIYIKNAILHVLNNDGGKSFISNEELDIDSDVCTEFITKHIKKLVDNPASKEASFKPESRVYANVLALKNSDRFFKDISRNICGHLSEIMNANVDIPSGDVLITQFEIDHEAYLAILKLNYKECFTHQISDAAGGSDNQIVKYRAVLPFDSGKVEEACLIPYEPMVIRLIEKPYPVAGQQTNYFSELFLECTPELSKKEAAQIINEITEEINQKFFNESIETSAKINAALIEEAAADEGFVRMENVAEKVFGDNEEAKNEYIALVRDAGLRADLKLGEKFTKSQFGTQKFKASNGVEIKFPAELSEDPTAIEFKYSDDGSVSIVLKNLRKA